MDIKIEIGSVPDIVAISKKIPEFEQITSRERLLSRIDGTVSLILLAKIDGTSVGYKVGYQLTEDTFYSWLGGVIPEYRSNGVATYLLNYQEAWARNSGYKQIMVKTMNRFPRMLKLLISNGYKVVSADNKAHNVDEKIVFMKKIAFESEQ